MTTYIPKSETAWPGNRWTIVHHWKQTTYIISSIHGYLQQIRCPYELQAAVVRLRYAKNTTWWYIGLLNLPLMPALRHHTHHEALVTQKGIGAPGILPGGKPLAFLYDTILRLTSNLPGSVRGYRNITRTEAGESLRPQPWCGVMKWIKRIVISIDDADALFLYWNSAC